MFRDVIYGKVILKMGNLAMQSVNSGVRSQKNYDHQRY